MYKKVANVGTGSPSRDLEDGKASCKDAEALGSLPRNVASDYLNDGLQDRTE